MSEETIVGGELIRMILAVAAIMLLFGLSFSLYGIFTDNQELKQAEATLGEIENVISNLEDGEEKEVVVLNPKGWVLTGWPSKGYTVFFPSAGVGTSGTSAERVYEDNPDKCELNGWEKCFCLCDQGVFGTNPLEWCNERSICTEIESEELYVNNKLGREDNSQIIIGSGKNIVIDKEETKLSIYVR